MEVLTSCAHPVGDPSTESLKTTETLLVKFAKVERPVLMQLQELLTVQPALLGIFALITQTPRHTILLKVVGMLHLDLLVNVVQTHSALETKELQQLALMVTIPTQFQELTTSLVANHMTLDFLKEVPVVLETCVLKELNQLSKWDALRVPVQLLELNLLLNAHLEPVMMEVGANLALLVRLHVLKAASAPVLCHHPSLQTKTSIPALLVRHLHQELVL
jgi:hypothetical protein